MPQQRGLADPSRPVQEQRPAAPFTCGIEKRLKAGLLTKSGIMLGLGEEWAEIEETVRAIRAAGTDILTIGQYLRPSAEHLPLRRYYTPEEFGRLREFALSLGYRHVESGPLVRSSYHAEEQVPGKTATTATTAKATEIDLHD